MASPFARSLFAMGIVLSLLLAPKLARALDVVDVELAFKGGAALAPNDFGGRGANPKGGPLGVGVGGRGGVSLAGFYGGVSALYYFGSEQVSGPTTGSAHSVVYGIELGYGILLARHWVLRAQLGVGNQTTSSSSVTPGVATFEDTQSFLYLEPGVTALFLFSSYFVGADVNAYILPNVTRPAPEAGTSSKVATAITVHGQLGVRF